MEQDNEIKAKPNWSIPPSRSEEGIDITWLGNATEEVKQKLEAIRKKLSQDISKVVNGDDSRLESTFYQLISS